MEKEVNYQEGDTVEVKGSPSGTTLAPSVPETLTAQPPKKKKKTDLDAFKSMFKNVGKIKIGRAHV